MNGFKTRIRIAWIKLLSWEYWPMWVVYFPVGFYYLFLSLKARSFFFFSASNPSIETGGMFFESKWSIFELMPKQYLPATILIQETDAMETIVSAMNQAGIGFPLIAKPDRGERGWGVKIIHTYTDLLTYRQHVAVPFLIQAYVDLPVEMSVFYYRHPSADKGIITSVTLKQLLTVTGDGQSTIGQLIRNNNRAFLQMKKLLADGSLDKDRVLGAGESQTLVPYGNHVRGAMFLDYNHIIDEQLTTTFDTLSRQIDGFYFGRFDLRCAGIEEMKNGNFMVLELNGAGAEPAHIYQPGFSFFKAQHVLAAHYKMMFDAAMENKQRGVAFMRYAEYKALKAKEKIYKSKLTTS